MGVVVSRTSDPPPDWEEWTTFALDDVTTVVGPTSFTVDEVFGIPDVTTVVGPTGFTVDGAIIRVNVAVVGFFRYRQNRPCSFNSSRCKSSLVDVITSCSDSPDVCTTR